MRQLDEHEEPPVFYCKSDNLNIRVPYSPDYSVKFVKQMLTERTGLEPGEQWLTFGGKQLEDGFTLRDYNIQKESTIFETEGLLGGGKRARPDDDSEKLRRVAEYKQGVDESLKSIDTAFVPTQPLVQEGSVYTAWMSGQQESSAVFQDCLSKISKEELEALRADLAEEHVYSRIEKVRNRLMRLACPNVFKALDVLTATTDAVGAAFDLKFVEAYMDNNGRMKWRAIESELDAELKVRARLAART